NGPRSDAPEPIGGVRPKAPRERLPYAGSAEIGGQKGRHSPRRWSEQKQAAPIGGGQGGAGAGENPAVHAMRGPDRGPQDQFQCERQREQDGPNQPTGSHKAPTGADEGGAGDQAAGQAETQSSHAASFAQHLLAQSREMPGEPIGREPKRGDEAERSAHLRLPPIRLRKRSTSRKRRFSSGTSAQTSRVMRHPIR